MKRMTLALAMTASLAATACLQKDTTSTIYLRQDGSFDWVVLEQNVRSDDPDGSKRIAEEAAYAESVSNGEHAVAEGFRAIGANMIQLRWVRSTRPYAVMVDARFDSLAGIFERLLARCGIPHEVALTRDGGVTTWRLRIDAGPEGRNLDDNVDDGCDEGLGGLIDALDVTIVLESGAFTTATGFTLKSADSAVIDEEALENAVKTNGQIELSLSWSSAAPSGRPPHGTPPARP
jgi:hypothetical protein